MKSNTQIKAVIIGIKKYIEPLDAISDEYDTYFGQMLVEKIHILYLSTYVFTMCISLTRLL